MLLNVMLLRADVNRLRKEVKAADNMAMSKDGAHREGARHEGSTSGLAPDSVSLGKKSVSQLVLSQLS